MIVLVTENVAPGLRGELTKWLLEAKAGVFVGKVSAAIRDRLWDKVSENLCGGAALLVYSYANEQGFEMKMVGTPKRSVVDVDGVLLIKTEGDVGR